MNWLCEQWQSDSCIVLKSKNKALWKPEARSSLSCLCLSAQKVWGNKFAWKVSSLNTTMLELTEFAVKSSRRHSNTLAPHKLVKTNINLGCVLQNKQTNKQNQDKTNKYIKNRHLWENDATPPTTNATLVPEFTGARWNLTGGNYLSEIRVECEHTGRMEERKEGPVSGQTKSRQTGKMKEELSCAWKLNHRWIKALLWKVFFKSTISL